MIKRFDHVTIAVEGEGEAKRFFAILVEHYAESYPFAYPPGLREELGACFETEPAGPNLAALLASIARDKRPTVEFLELD